MEQYNYNYRQQPYRKNRVSYSASPMPQAPCNSAACSGILPDNSCEYSAIDRLPLAMAYVPWQHWGKVYEPCKALYCGTIFPELDLPFCERSCGR